MNLNLLVSLAGLAALVPYFRATAYPLIKSWTLFPYMGVRPTLANRAVLITVFVWFAFYSSCVIADLTGRELPTVVAIAGWVGLGWTILVSRLQFRFAPVEPLPAVRAAIEIADSHESRIIADAPNAREHAARAVAAWQRVIELAPENAGIRERHGLALSVLAEHCSPREQQNLRARAEREFALAETLRDAHDRLERLSPRQGTVRA
jgi:hypothetical protein